MKENNLEFKCDKLVGRIIEKFKTRENFAAKVPMSVPTLINKLNGSLDGLSNMLDHEQIDKAKQEINKIKDEISKTEDPASTYIDSLVKDIK